jgi:hypothetical protein
MVQHICHFSCLFEDEPKLYSIKEALSVERAAVAIYARLNQLGGHNWVLFQILT